MAIDLYYMYGSPPCHFVLLVAAALGVELNLKFVNISKQEQFQPEYLKLNPQHTIPTMVDDGFVLWESRAISTYLIEKYGKNDSLYPKDLKQRAIINQRLYFDIGTLYSSFIEYFLPQLFFGTPADPVKLEKGYQALNYLNLFLENQKYVAGDKMTVADLSIAASVECFKLMDFDISKYNNTSTWLERIKLEAPKYNDIMNKGNVAYKMLYVDNIKKKSIDSMTKL